jgi:hypothetical protein
MAENPPEPGDCRQASRCRGDEPVGMVEISADNFCVDAEVIASGLHLNVSGIQSMMKSGEITSICERGEGEDAGRHRLTFRHGSARLRVVADISGRVIAVERL